VPLSFERAWARKGLGAKVGAMIKRVRRRCASQIRIERSLRIASMRNGRRRVPPDGVLRGCKGLARGALTRVLALAVLWKVARREQGSAAQSMLSPLHRLSRAHRFVVLRRTETLLHEIDECAHVRGQPALAREHNVHVDRRDRPVGEEGHELARSQRRSTAVAGDSERSTAADMGRLSFLRWMPNALFNLTEA
jgi:hypothetical protein